MDWLKNNYDKAILTTAVIALLVCLGMIAFNAINIEENFSDRDSSKQKQGLGEEPPFEQIDEANKLADKPQTWDDHNSSLLVSRIYIFKNEQLFDPLEGSEMIHPPVPNEWFVKYNIDYTSPDVLKEDADGDGFNNREEFSSQTNPNDKDSRPPLIRKLRLAEFISVPFKMKFNGTPDDGESFMINSEGVRGTLFLKIGDTIDKSPYKIISYEKKESVVNEIETDVSELTIENTETGKKIILVANVPANDPTSYAKFALLIGDKKTFEVKLEDEFSIAIEPEKKYKLLDITAEEAKILDLSTDKEVKIPKM